MNAGIIPTLAGDRLYSINLRPQELALYGERVDFSLRYGPIGADADGPDRTHYKLLVLEITVDLPPDDELAAGKPLHLQLLKCGWELTLTTSHDCLITALQETDQEVPHLLGRIADTVNELSRRAGLEAPLAPTVIEQLTTTYRLKQRDDRAVN